MSDFEYKKYIEFLKEKTTIEIIDDSFLDNFILTVEDEYQKEETNLNFYIPIYFDPDKAFGLNVCSYDNDDYINLYVDWHPDEQLPTMSMTYWTYDDNCISLDVILTVEQQERVLKRLNSECERIYGLIPEKMWYTNY